MANVAAARGLSWRSVVSRPEFAPILLLFLAIFAGRQLSDFFKAQFLLDASSEFMEAGLIALGMTFVIVAGQIDLSVASTLALVACVSGKMMAAGSPIWLSCLTGITLGGVLGWINGWLVARLRLPSFVVTLSTMAIYRGVAQVIMGAQSVTLPSSFNGADLITLPLTPIPLPLAMFLVLALVCGLLLAKTVFGRWVYAVGTNEEAAYYSGVPTGRVKVLVFVLAGALSGLAGLLMDSRLTVARFDHARGMELDVITAVVLGGTSIYGGRGTVLGSVLALFLIGLVRKGMGVANVTAEYQLTVIGCLLVLAVVLTNLSARLEKAR